MSAETPTKVTDELPSVIVLDPEPVAPYPITVSLPTLLAEGTVSAPIYVFWLPVVSEVPPTDPSTIWIAACLPIPTFLLPVVNWLKTCLPRATFPPPEFKLLRA